MADCQNCGFSWSWKTLMKTFKRFDQAMPCPNCGAPQYLTASARRRFSVIALLPTIIMTLFAIIFDLQVWHIFALLIVLLPAALASFPFTAKLSNEDEPMW